MVPTIEGQKKVRGIALDGYMKDDEPRLASSTMGAEENLTGFIISYVARVKLNLGSMNGGELIGDVPLRLMRPLPGKWLVCSSLPLKR